MTNRIFLERRSGQAPAATQTLMSRFLTLKIDFKTFSGEPEDWNNRFRIHHTQLSAIGSIDTLKAEGQQDTKIGGLGFDVSNKDAPSGAPGMGFAYDHLQRSRFNDCSGRRVTRQRMIEARAELPRERPRGAGRLTGEPYCTKAKLSNHTLKLKSSAQGFEV